MKSKENSSRLLSIAKMKCPHCHEGNLFSSPNLYNFNQTLVMPENCDKCGQNFELETGFWTGAMYIGYAIVVAIVVTFFIGFMVLFPMPAGEVVLITLAFVVAVYPFILRYARVLYIYIFVNYQSDAIEKFRESN
ncbi:MAG: hypothetical protein RLZZ175_1970 [Bacteroidota bacterium]|jgi:uncharacterized protein (DUF983 family)